MGDFLLLNLPWQGNALNRVGYPPFSLNPAEARKLLKASGTVGAIKSVKRFGKNAEPLGNNGGR